MLHFIESATMSLVDLFKNLYLIGSSSKGVQGSQISTQEKCDYEYTMNRIPDVMF